MGRAEELFATLVNEGASAVDRFIDERASEELFLDFKRSESNGDGKKLSPNDLKNLGKAISGFGNSSGGVIVWGVDCSLTTDSSDVAKAKVYIKNPKRFRSWLEGAVGGRTLPPHNMVISHVIEVNENEGFVVTLIPQSNSAPHQDIKEKRYYMRAGSDFLPVTHDIIAGMFGRRPQPRIVQQYLVKQAFFEGDSLKVELPIWLRNDGAGIGSDVFLCADILSAPVDLFINKLDQKDWNTRFIIGACYTAVGTKDLKIPPTGKAIALIMSAVINENTARDVRIHANCGCDGGPVSEFMLESRKEEYLPLYKEILNKKKKDQDFEKDLYLFTRTFWGLADFSKESPKISGDITP